MDRWATHLALDKVCTSLQDYFGWDKNKYKGDKSNHNFKIVLVRKTAASEHKVTRARIPFSFLGAHFKKEEKEEEKAEKEEEKEEEEINP